MVTISMILGASDVRMGNKLGCACVFGKIAVYHESISMCPNWQIIKKWKPIIVSYCLLLIIIGKSFFFSTRICIKLCSKFLLQSLHTIKHNSVAYENNNAHSAWISTHFVRLIPSWLAIQSFLCITFINLFLCSAYLVRFYLETTFIGPSDRNLQEDFITIFASLFLNKGQLRSFSWK